MNTAREIEEAIRPLSISEREKLLHHIHSIFPELGGDAEWERLIRDERKLPSLTKLLDENEATFSTVQRHFPK